MQGTFLFDAIKLDIEAVKTYGLKKSLKLLEMGGFLGATAFVGSEEEVYIQ